MPELQASTQAAEDETQAVDHLQVREAELAAQAKVVPDVKHDDIGHIAYMSLTRREPVFKTN